MVAVHQLIRPAVPVRIAPDIHPVPGQAFAVCGTGQQPVDHGFDHWFSTQNNALPNHRNPVNFVRNGQPVGKLEGYSAQLVAAEAIRWLREGRDKSKPFFLYVCFHEPHEPIASDPQFAKLYPSEDPSYTAHHGNITQMDDAFGRLMRSLDGRAATPAKETLS
jgi:arylsulfatase A